MTPTASDRLARFGRLPRNPAEVWQGALIRIPAWVEKGPDGKPYRPNGAFCVSLLSGRVNQKTEPQPGAQDPSLLLECLMEFGLDRELSGCRPGRIEVADQTLAIYLKEHLAGAGVAVTVTPGLAELKEVLDHFGEYMNQRPLPPNALDAPGVTLDHMRAFAVTAKTFYEAAPWRHLSDEDLVHVEVPSVAPGLRYFTVMGGAGMTFGLGFYNAPSEFDALVNSNDPHAFIQDRGHWTVLYGPIQDLPFGDADLWQDNGLPVAGDQAYPVAVRFGPGEEIGRPGPDLLSDLEGLLLALAATNEDEIDRGRWTHEVQTSAGRKTVTLCLPDLLEPLEATPKHRPGEPVERRAMERAFAEMERFMAEGKFKNLDEANAALQREFSGPIFERPSTAGTPPEKAQELMYRAFDSRGRRRIQLARKALELCPDCADAYVLLAEEAHSPEAALDLYRQAVSAGECALGPQVMQDEVGHFWGITATRPYMRALLGLAQTLETLGDVDGAIERYRELLRLNPNDNQGVRDLLLPRLLEANRDEEAGALLRKYAEDGSAEWQYGWALWIFRAEGDSPAARERLQAARRANRFVPDYLSGKTPLPEDLPDSYSFGSKEEAVLCADALLNVWQTTPGAAAWLQVAKPKRSPKKRSRR